MSNIEPLPNIDFELFSKLDLRVATVTACEAHSNADKLLKVTLDDGTAEGRQVCAGVKAWYEPEELVGRHVHRAQDRRAALQRRGQREAER